MLNESQRNALFEIIQLSAANASQAMSQWLGRSVHVHVESLEEQSLETAMGAIGEPESTLCAGCMRMSGAFDGQLLFTFDDPSGLALCDALLMRETQSAEWGELEISAAMETANIVGCAFLNALAQRFPHATEDMHGDKHDNTWMPSPPLFVRDYAAAILQFAVADQAAEMDSVLVAKTEFVIDGAPVAWHLLLIPDAASFRVLQERLP